MGSGPQARTQAELDDETQICGTVSGTAGGRNVSVGFPVLSAGGFGLRSHATSGEMPLPGGANSPSSDRLRPKCYSEAIELQDSWSKGEQLNLSWLSLGCQGALGGRSSPDPTRSEGVALGTTG